MSFAISSFIKLNSRAIVDAAAMLFPILKCSIEGHEPKISPINGKPVWDKPRLEDDKTPKYLFCSRCHLVYWESASWEKP